MTTDRRMRIVGVVLGAALGFTAAFLVAAEEQGFTPIPVIKGVKSLEAGKAAPVFTVKDTDGKVFDFAAERAGRAHVLVFWSIFCEPPIQKKGYLRRPGPDHKAIERAAGLIYNARHPLIILSSGANRKLITKRLEEFIDKTGIYVVHTQMGKGVISDESAYSLFAIGIHRRDYVSCAIDRADLIITIGYNIVEYPPYLWNTRLDKRIINLDFVEAEVDRYYSPDVELIGDISHCLQQLKDRVRRTDGREFAKVREFLVSKLSPEVERRYPPTPQQVVRHVREEARSPMVR